MFNKKQRGYVQVTAEPGKFGLDIEMYSSNFSGDVEEFPSLGVFKNSLDNNLPGEGIPDQSSLCEDERDHPFYML